ncbi:MAG: hypothetical protein ACM3NN_09680 [Nitrospirota bacterium]
MKTPPKYLAAALMLCICTLFSDYAISQATSSPSASETPTPNGSRARHRPKGMLVPYHGVISAVDKNAKTFTIEGRSKSRVLKIIEGTPITKNGETATIDDINKDDEVSGSYLKDADGTLLARTVKIGPIKHRGNPTPTASPRR